MRIARCCIALLALTVSVLPAIVRAENWPCWRGPRGDGTSGEKNVPVHWNGETGENIVWRTAIPGEGHASPIVWEDTIFVVSCLLETQERVLIAVDRRDGSIRWQRTVLRAPLETKHALNSYASSTPATDGRRVYVTFLEVDGSTIAAPNVSRPRPVTPGRMVVAAYDFEGRRLWLVRPGPFVSAHGFCSSPVLYKDLVIVNGDHDGDGFLVALDKRTGQIVWKTPRENNTRSYVTPIIRTIDGRPQLVLSGSKMVAAYDPDSGKPLWKVDGPTEQFVASLVFDGQRFYVAGGFPTHHVLAIRPTGRGDVTETHVVWHQTNAKCYVPSPILVGRYLLVPEDRGTANCYDAPSGELLWKARMGNHFSTSLVAANGLVYFVADNGVTKVVRPGPQLQIVAENPLGQYCYASPAISNGQIFIRGEDELFCIGESQRK